MRPAMVLVLNETTQDFNSPWNLGHAFTDPDSLVVSWLNTSR
jgi:hypothetical protein